MSVGSIRYVKLVLRRMLPHLCEKHVEVAAALDYLEDRITGNDFQDIPARVVRRGNRERIGVRIDLPWVRSEGWKRASKHAASTAGWKPTIGETDQAGLVAEYEAGLSQREASARNGLSRDKVRRTLARRDLADR